MTGPDVRLNSVSSEEDQSCKVEDSLPAFFRRYQISVKVESPGEETLNQATDTLRSAALKQADRVYKKLNVGGQLDASEDDCRALNLLQEPIKETIRSEVRFPCRPDITSVKYGLPPCLSHTHHICKPKQLKTSMCPYCHCHIPFTARSGCQVKLLLHHKSNLCLR
jgi:hypothetical protein